MTDARAASGRGALALAGSGVLFASTFLVVQRAIEDAEPLPFLGARFLIAAAVLFPFARRRPSSPDEWRLGIAVGAALSVSYLLQTTGLRHTETSTSAFITYLLVVIVPLIVAVLDRRRPEARVVVGVIVATAGLWLLSGGTGGGFGLGEALTLLCAVGFAAHVVAVGRIAGRLDPVRFTFVQLLTVGVVCGVPGLFVGGYAFGPVAWAGAAFTGVFATAVAFFGMVVGQRTVPAARAALILLIEPVVAGLLGVATGEELGWTGLVGALTILVAIGIVEVLPLLRGEVVDDPAVEPTVHG